MAEIKVPGPKVLYKSVNITATLTYSQDLEARLNNFYGLGGPLQKYIDGQFMDAIEEYMPYDNGDLIMSMIDNTTLGDGVNITKSPYAWFVYYGKLMIDPNTGSAWAQLGQTKVTTNIDLQYQGAPKRGAFWDVRWAADNYDAFIEKIQGFVDGS